ncbi:BfmA/BtgA family mobilization protein [Sediminicola luteus]|uniref:Uncharacterized protein n=1 Tax=Sediminicola luteus TaxID=319238 RepID=A0A2A4G3K1_9FLAO|nr:BfmA/BtgA family mobilization protein [Sediminicola luteus]PCE63003.1 hypothetical protein B7P33_17155 [Sediminicola luteus]
MDGFGTIRIHKKTLERFKIFSRKAAMTYSDCLESCMDFFTFHGIGPKDRFGPRFQREQDRTRKRIDAVVAIIKNIERHQTRPTLGLLEALIEQTTRSIMDHDQGHHGEREGFPEPIQQTEWERLLSMEKELQELLDCVIEVNPRMGKPYLRLQTPISKINRLKMELKR